MSRPEKRQTERPVKYVDIAAKQRKEIAAAREAGTFDGRAHLDKSPIGQVLNAGAFAHIKG